MYRNALVATDGSRVASAVFEHVRKVVDPNGTVLVVEVIDDVSRVFARTTPAGFDFGGVAMQSELAEKVVAAQRAAAESHLAAAQQQLQAAGMAHVDTAILSGMPGDAIVRQVAKAQHDIVLMGTHGRSGLRRTVLGSVADYVLRHLDGTPVLMLRGTED